MPVLRSSVDTGSETYRRNRQVQLAAVAALNEQLVDRDIPKQAGIFVHAGQTIHDLIQLSAPGIPTLALVFANSTAGGAYVPGMCDHAVLIDNQAKVFLGGADMHTRVSGLGDYFAVDEMDWIRIGRQARQSVRLPGAAHDDTYLDGAAIIAAAGATGADAGGYGFLSQNADFAAACADARLTFVGPRPDATAAMGSKIAAKELMAASGVPVLPGTPVDRIASAAQRACAPAGISGLADPGAVAEIGYPVLVKAASGGGRGMRIVYHPAELADSIESARREAESAFGNGALFIERFIDNPRQVEVQILGDHEGTVIPLLERECPIQRRQRACELGLVNEVVPLADLRTAVQALAERIAANAPPVLAAKRTAYLSRPDVFEAAEEIWRPVYLSADAQEGPAAFRDKRRPVWTGR